MKKSLFALAAATAVTGAAQAQSSVTVYGIVDAGFISSSVRGPVAPTASTTNQFGTSAETSSRLGFKGTEDLGGGLSAFFTVETGLAPTNAAGATAGAAGGWNNRQSFLGLKKNGVGQFAFGTQYTTIHTAVGATDPGAQNNMMGNVIYASDPANSTGNVGTRPSSFANGSGGTDAYTVRTANTLNITTDTFAGLQATGFYTLANTNSNQVTSVAAGTITITGGQNNWSGFGVGLNYSIAKGYLTANYQSLKQQTSAGSFNTTTGVYSAASSIWGGAGNGGTSAANRVQDGQAYIAGTYDFGVLKAYAQWINRKATSTVDSSIYAKRSAQQLGVRSYITPKIESWASIGNGRVSTYGTGEPTANFNAWQLGSNYYLSKRTNLYAIYGKTQTSNTVSSGAATGSTMGETVSYGGSNYAVGLRHTF